MKTCKYCNVDKDILEFNYSNKTLNKHKPYCKSCESELNKKRYLQTRAERLESTKTWQQANKEKYLQYQKKYNEYRKTRQQN